MDHEFEEVTGECFFGCGGSAADGHEPGCPSININARLKLADEMAKIIEEFVTNHFVTIPFASKCHRIIQKYKEIQENHGKDGPEFPTYYDAQGNEHAEF